MATIYTDIYNRTKENITVLRKPGTPEDGITPQLVKLVNTNNEYAGKFTGEAYFTTGSFQNAVIDKALLQNSTLSNVSFANGLNLDTIGVEIEALSARDDELKEIIDEETAARIACSTKIYTDLLSGLTNLSNELSLETSNREDDVLLHRHMTLARLNEDIYPYTLSDWTVNTIKTNYIDAIVYVENSENRELPIGKIENTEYNAPIDKFGKTTYVQLTAFDLHLFNSAKKHNILSAASKKIYHFTVTQTEAIADDAGKFEFKWNAGAALPAIDLLFKSVIDSDNQVQVPLTVFRCKNEMKVLMPDKKTQIPGDSRDASSKFIFNIKVEDRTFCNQLHEMAEELIAIKLVAPDPRDMYFYLDRPVDKLFIQKNRYSTFKFEEIRPHKFIITDLDQSKLYYELHDIKRDVHNTVKQVNLFGKALNYVDSKVSHCLSVDSDNIPAAVDGLLLKDVCNGNVYKVVVANGQLSVIGDNQLTSL